MSALHRTPQAFSVTHDGVSDWSNHIVYTAFRWGHKWVVLALLAPVPWATRRWALPLLVTLYRSQEENQKQARRHKTPPQLLGQMLRILMRWFPDRTFVATADANYASHELAELAARVPRRLTQGSKF